MNLTAQQCLTSVFGFDAFRPPQDRIVEHIIDGGDALVLMPTGGGKSLCYQVPALVRSGTAIVVSPLIALMQDQVTALRQYGVSAAYLNSSLDAEQAALVEQQLCNGELSLLYVAPERLVTPRLLSLLRRCEIALFAIDEAHCVSQWGHDFRPEYIQLSLLHEQFPTVPRIALTATADEQTRREIIDKLALHDAALFNNGFDRPNIRYRINENQTNAKEQLLRFIRNEHQDDAGIVYCLSRRRVEDVAQWLNTKGITALAYHAGLSSELRQHHQQRFLREEGVVIVATIAFGMGIDKPDVRFVAHLNLPKSIEAYYQETGRAGRDGLAANAWMAYGLQDAINLRQMQSGSTAAEQFKRVERQKLDAMLGLCELISCRRQALLRYFGDTLDQPCGNCDNCLQPPQTWDASVSAQKALSCVYRTGQRFGVNYLIELLLGKSSDRSSQMGHESLTVFGIGTELHTSEWRSLFRQLIASGVLVVDAEGFGSIRLTESARPILKGEQSVILRRPSKAEKTLRNRSSAKVNSADAQLWQQLRSLRAKLADAQNVPAYVIFSDATLVDMIDRQPQTLAQMLLVSGVGERKLEAYGEAFLNVLHDFNNDVASSTNNEIANKIITMRCRGITPLDIAKQCDTTINSVYNHLAKAIELGDVDLQDAVDLTPHQLDQIRNVLEFNADKPLKLSHDDLEGVFDIGVLRCVKASLGQML